jgi:adenylate cyclase
MEEEAPDRDGGEHGRLARAARALRRADSHPKLLQAARTTRELLPGDPRFGDELSTAGDRMSEILGRFLAESGEHESTSRELGLTALQVWQALSESTGRGRGFADVAILFTDLVDFSSWALEVGDEQALALLRELAAAVEPAIKTEAGRIVKRLGDGHMAVFADPTNAVAAALDIQRRVATIDVAGYRPKLRAGIHCGRPRKIGRDYLGIDVNVAARVMGAAGGGEVLISETALAGVRPVDGIEVKRLRRFRAKGAPRDLAVYSVTPAARS